MMDIPPSSNVYLNDGGGVSSGTNVTCSSFSLIKASTSTNVPLQQLEKILLSEREAQQLTQATCHKGLNNKGLLDC